MDVSAGDPGGLDLVAEPNKVAKIDIHFERVAKKLDVKALKTSMWKKLEDMNEEAVEPDPTTQFTQMLKDIPDIIPKEMVPAVSVPFCFICLLHLANEKTLKLEDSTSLNELNIQVEGQVA